MNGDVATFRSKGSGYSGTYSATIDISQSNASNFGSHWIPTYLEPVTKANRPLISLLTGCNRSVIFVCSYNLQLYVS